MYRLDPWSVARTLIILHHSPCNDINAQLHTVYKLHVHVHVRLHLYLTSMRGSTVHVHVCIH